MHRFKDFSLYALLAANLFILIQFHLGFIEVGAVIWTYWLQSFFMIITWAMRLAQLGFTKKGSAADLGFTIHVDRLVKPGFKTEYDYSGVSAFLLFVRSKHERGFGHRGRVPYLQVLSRWLW